MAALLLFLACQSLGPLLIKTGLNSCNHKNLLVRIKLCFYPARSIFTLVEALAYLLRHHLVSRTALQCQIQNLILHRLPLVSVYLAWQFCSRVA